MYQWSGGCRTPRYNLRPEEDTDMKKLLLFMAGILISTSAQASAIESCHSQIPYGPPSYSGILLCRLGYIVSYNTAHKTADWVAYHLTREEMHGNIPRTNDYRPDPDLSPSQQVQVSDYSHSDYMPGQLVPAATMRWSVRAMSESFLLSNTAPRTKGMNNGIWKALEQKVRDWVDSRGELYVVTGNIYNSSNPKTIGPDHVAVPSAFYKVIFDPIQVEAIAFIIPNRNEDPLNLPKFITSVDKVEQATGLDFLPNIDDSVESLIETQRAPFWMQ